MQASFDHRTRLGPVHLGKVECLLRGETERLGCLDKLMVSQGAFQRVFLGLWLAISGVRIAAMSEDNAGPDNTRIERGALAYFNGAVVVESHPAANLARRAPGLLNIRVCAGLHV